VKKKNTRRVNFLGAALSFQAIYWHEQYSKMGE